MLSKLLNIWEILNGNKVLIGMILYFLVDHIFPRGTWYADATSILAYAFLFLGGTHKLIKVKDDYKKDNFIRQDKEYDNFANPSFIREVRISNN